MLSIKVVTDWPLYLKGGTYFRVTIFGVPISPIHCKTGSQLYMVSGVNRPRKVVILILEMFRVSFDLFL